MSMNASRERQMMRGQHPNGGGWRWKSTSMRMGADALTVPPLSECRFGNNGGQIVESHDNVPGEGNHVLIKVAYRAEQFAVLGHQRNPVVALIAALLGVPIDTLV